MNLAVDLKKCLRSGQCFYLHPELFKEGDDGYPLVLVAEPDAEQQAAAEEAEELCPGQAIRLERKR